jgi:putative N6-adenine-specific DNA methylase
VSEPRPQSHIRLFVTVSPGLEPWLVAELRDLGLTGKIASGGVELRTSTEQLWQLHHDSRLAEHIRVRLKSFHARHFDELVAGLQRLPWHAYLDRSRCFDVHVTCHRSRLWHSDAVAQRTRMAIEGKSGPTDTNRRDPGGDISQSVYIRIAGDRVQPSVDASGERLHRRGRRILVGRAPLRETLAAALVRILNESAMHDTDTIWDPFCGSGCLLVEWAESRLGLSAGRDRSFAFEHWPIHNAMEYATWLQGRATPVPTPLRAFGSDIDPQPLAAAQTNATLSSTQDCHTWLCGDFESFADAIPHGTAIVTNPPYGVRSGDSQSYARLMHRFEMLLARRIDLRPAVVLVPNPLHPWRPGLAWHAVASFHNGGLPVQVLRLI